MRQRLSKTLIDSLTSPEQGQYIIRDLELKGFALRVTPNCKSFVVEFTLSGVRKRVSIGRCDALNVEDARRQAQLILADAARVIEFIPEQKVPTLAEVLNKYIAERQIKTVTKRSYRRHMERSLPDWLDLPINRISKEMVNERYKALLKPTRCGTSNKASANSAMRILRTLFKFAGVSFSKVDDPTDTLRWRWYRVDARQGTIPDNRLADFYRAVMKRDKLCRDLLLVLLFTALRRGEASKLRWADVDFDKKLITIPATKNGKAHVLPMTKMVQAILESRQRESIYVFPGRFDGHVNEPRQSLLHLRQVMGWQFLLHDLRRTALSSLEKIGAPYAAIARIANHALERGVSDRYVILDVEFIRPHMEAMNMRLLELMETSADEWKKLDVVGFVKPHFELIESIVVLQEEQEDVYW